MLHDIFQSKLSELRSEIYAALTALLATDVAKQSAHLCDGEMALDVACFNGFTIVVGDDWMVEIALLNDALVLISKDGDYFSINDADIEHLAEVADHYKEERTLSLMSKLGFAT